MLAAQALPPGTALRQPVQPWCPDAHRAQIGALALHLLPSLFPLSFALSLGVACVLLQSMMGHACKETIKHKQGNAAGCWLPPVHGRVLAGWGAASAARHSRCGWASLKVPALGCYAFLDSAGQVLYGCIHIGLLDGLLQQCLT